MLWACDVNFVRGEDSLVRALWAGKPLVWHIYPQHDDAHDAKLEAFLDWLQAPASLRAFHRRLEWPGSARPGIARTHRSTPELWQDCAARARQILLHKRT